MHSPFRPALPLPPSAEGHITRRAVEHGEGFCDARRVARLALGLQTAERQMRKVFVLAIAPAIVAWSALAAPGVTTTGVNLRSGPGTNFSATRSLPAGTAIDIGQCDDSGSWCAVTARGQKGFVSGKYLRERADQNGWPRAFDVGKGRILLFQPQFTE